MVKGWEIYCNEEARSFPIDSKANLFTCPTNPAHTIDRTKTREIVIRRPNDVFVVEEEKQIAGYLAIEGISHTATFDVLGPSLSTKEVSWPFNITMLSSTVITDANSDGDLLNVYVNKYTTVGYTLAASAIGATTFAVSNTVLQYADIGMLMTITNGVTTNELGYMLGYDIAAGTITVQTAATDAFAFGSYIQISIHMVRNVTLAPSSVVGAGETNFSSSFVPAGTTMRIEYLNQSTAQQKSLRINVQYYY